MSPLLSFPTMRRLHLYLGCFFAPLLLFFTVSGVCQTFVLHRGDKLGTYKPPKTIVRLSEPHMHQRMMGSAERSTPFRWLVVAMSAGLLISILLGIAMALKLERARWVWASLALGVLVPVLFLS